MANISDEGNISVCQGSDHQVYYNVERKYILPKTLKIESLVLLLLSVLVVNKYMQHAVTVFLYHYCLQYCFYFVSDDIKLPDTIHSS